MARHDGNSSQPKNGAAVAFPLPANHWKAVCHTMGLTGQLAKVVELVLRNRGDQEIADEMGLRIGTVKDYLVRIGRQTGTSGRVQLLIYLLKISHDLLASPAETKVKQR